MTNESEGAHDNHKCTFTFRGKLECGKEDEPCQALDFMIMDKMRSEYQRLTTENIELKAKLSVVKLTPESLKDKEEKVKYLTGLPGYLTLMQVFQLLEPFVQESTRSTLSKFEKLMLVLMKLRLNLPLQDLAYRFDISKSTVSRTFNSVIHVMYERMKSFVFWPDREQLR